VESLSCRSLHPVNLLISTNFLDGSAQCELDPLFLSFDLLTELWVERDALRARFWCRYICPLGALLGVAGKNPTVRLATDPAACNIAASTSGCRS
jgi:hypothetical protein